MPIETIRAGDMVLSRNLESGVVEIKPVSKTFVRQADDVVDVTIVGAGGKQSDVQPTSEHPFLVEGKGWTAAAALRPGDLLWGPTGVSVVERERTLDGTRLVHNFEVEDDHTYLVGTDGVLVHNACGGLQVPEGAAQGAGFGSYQDFYGDLGPAGPGRLRCRNISIGVG